MGGQTHKEQGDVISLLKNIGDTKTDEQIQKYTQIEQGGLISLLALSFSK
jgi:hypothetical protein